MGSSESGGKRFLWAAVLVGLWAVGCGPKKGQGEDGGEGGGGEDAGTRGPPVLLAGGELSITGLALDSDYVYWVSGFSGDVKRAPKGGGTHAVLASGQSKAQDLVVTPEGLYFLVRGGTGGAIMKVGLGGGAATSVVGGQYNPARLAVEGTKLYWTNQSSGAAGKAQVVALERTDSTWSVLLWGAAGDEAVGVAAAQGQVFWTDRGHQTVNRVSLTSPNAVLATVTNLAGTPVLGNVAVWGSNVFFTDEGGQGTTGGVYRLPVGGGAAELLVAAERGAVGLAVDDTGVYWTDQAAGRVVKTPLAGGESVELVRVSDSPAWVSLDADWVYVATGGGSVFRIAK